MNEFGVRELVLATIHEASGHGGKRAAARLHALQRAFDVRDDDERRHDPLEHLFEDAVRAYLTVTSPFDGYLEAPPEVNRMCRHHGARIGRPADELRAALLDLLTDLAVARWALPPSMMVTEKDLLRYGFDAAEHPEPDEDDW